MIALPLESDLKKYDCDSAYLKSAIETKVNLMLFENERVKELSSTLDSFEERLVNMINAYIQSKGRNTFNQSDANSRKQFIALMKTITNELQEWLLANETEVTVQTYEFVVDGQMWLLSDYIDSLPVLPDKGVIRVIGGEQTKGKDKGLSKPKITADKAKDLVTKPRVKKTVDARIKDAISDFEDELIRIFDESTRAKSKTSSVDVINKMRTAMENKIRKTAEFSLRSGIQTIEEEAIYDVWHENEWVSPTEFQRVEILDTRTCLGCLFVDTSINPKPLGLLHYNCRGIDIPIYYDENGKMIRVDGVNYSRRRLSFTDRFEKLSKKEKVRMLGKGKYSLYENGKLKPVDFMGYGGTITLGEAEKRVALKSIRSQVKTPETAMKVNAVLERGFPPISSMDESQLNEYVNILGQQKEVLGFVPKKNFFGKSYLDYVSELDNKFELINLRRKTITK